jgi:type II restriction enzyme
MDDYSKIDLSIINDDIYSSVKEQLETQVSQRVYRQKEYLMTLFTKTDNSEDVRIRNHFLHEPFIFYVLNLKVEDIESPFEEKQNDTADILVVKKGFYELIDIKTRNISKSAQPPNIISAYKLAQLCAKMIDNNEFDNFTINYFEIDWLLENDKLVCKDAHWGCLFNASPDNLYINWAAAMQIQFHVCDLDQSFKGTREQWAKNYLKHFVSQAQKRADDMITKFVKPFEKYVKD